MAYLAGFLKDDEQGIAEKTIPELAAESVTTVNNRSPTAVVSLIDKDTTREEFLHYSGRPELVSLYYIGHGLDGFIYSSLKQRIAPRDIRCRAKLGSVVLVSCQAGLRQEAWLKVFNHPDQFKAWPGPVSYLQALFAFNLFYYPAHLDAVIARLNRAHE